MSKEKLLREQVKELREIIEDHKDAQARQARQFNEWQQKLFDDNRELQRRVTFLLDLCGRHGIPHQETRGHLTLAEWEQLRMEVEAL